MGGFPPSATFIHCVSELFLVDKRRQYWRAARVTDVKKIKNACADVTSHGIIYGPRGIAVLSNLFLKSSESLLDAGYKPTALNSS